jgi:hypothetical protein
MRVLLIRFLSLAALAVPLAATASIIRLLGTPTPADASVQFQFFGGSDSYAVRESERGFGFYFTRAVYRSGGRGNGWATDWPTADRWITDVLARLTILDVYEGENGIQLDDPELRRFPFLYAVEVGGMALRPAEREGLRNYLLAGGFLVVDDFWGSREWAQFESEIMQVLPEYEIVDIGFDHPIFQSYYLVDQIVQVPNITNGCRGGPTYEDDGYVPHFRGILDEENRLMVAINWNTDLGDAWEHAEDPCYPLMYSTYAYQMAANFILYSTTR